MNEQATRKKLINSAKMVGCEKELLQILAKYDALLRGCTNAEEAKAIAALGALEVHKLFGAGSGTLEVDGKVVYQSDDVKEIK